MRRVPAHEVPAFKQQTLGTQHYKGHALLAVFLYQLRQVAHGRCDQLAEGFASGTCVQRRQRVSINYTPMGIAASSGAKYVLIPTDCGPAKLRHEEFHISNTTLSGKLAGQGITIPSKKDLEQLIQAVSEISHFGPALVAEHPGWCGKAFAQQDGTVIGPERDGVHVVFQPNAGRIRSRGTLAEWQEQVAGPVARQPIPAFAIMAAFLPAVLRFMPQVGNVTLELVGSADTGKSTIQKLAASVAYPPDGLNSCRDVQRDLHGLLDAGWDYPLFLDHAEPTLLTATKPKKAELYAAIAFDLLRASGGRLIMLSGREPLREACGVGSADETVLSLRIPGGDHGVFRRAPRGFANAAGFADSLVTAARAHHGHAYPELVKALLDQPSADKIKRRVAQFQSNFYSLAKRKGFVGCSQRSLRTIGAIYAVGRAGPRGRGCCWRSARHWRTW